MDLHIPLRGSLGLSSDIVLIPNGHMLLSGEWVEYGLVNVVEIHIKEI
jgi:hypothetical protein